MELDGAVTEIKTGIDKVLARQEEIEKSVKSVEVKIGEVEKDFVPRKVFDEEKASTAEWVKGVEAKVNDRFAGGGGFQTILPAIPERHRGMVSMFERSGKSEKDSIRLAAIESWFKNVLTLLYPNRRPDLDIATMKGEIETINKGFGFVSKASLTGADDVSGGYLIPVPVEAEVLRQMEDAANIRSLARIMPMTKRTHAIPDLQTNVTVNITDEGGTISDSLPASPFGQKMLTARKFTALATLSSEVIQDSAIGIVSFVMQLIAEKLALKEEFQALEGDGTGNNFLGLANVSGTNAVSFGTNGSTPTYSLLVQTKWGSRKRSGRKSAAWISAPEIWMQTEALAATDGKPIWSQSMQQGIAGQGNAEGLLLGFPAYSNADVSVGRTQGSATNCADVYFGKWSSLIIGDLLGINISASEHVNFTSDQIVLRMIKRTGILVGVPADFTVAVGAKIA